jgi:hypothetical protein
LIEISHYIESAPVETAQISAVELPPDGESSEPAEPGAFAKILAGLLRNCEAESQIPGDGSEDAVLLAGNGEISTEFEPEEDSAAFEQLKGPKSGKNQIKPAKPGITGEEEETPLFSELNQNILFGPQLLVNRQDDTGDDTQVISINDEVLIEASSDFFIGTESDIESMVSLNEAVNMNEDELNTGRKNQAEVKSPDAEDIRYSGEIAESQGAKDNAVFDGGSGGSQEDSKNAEGKKGLSKLDEVRRERRERPIVEVRDLRTTGDPRPDSGPRFNAAEGPRGDAREIALELRLPEQNAPSVETSWETRSSQAFEDLLARELHQNFNNDIVRHASMILRDEGRGTIRLALRPESLGHVKIRLEMAENKITGHIVVESEEALRAFEREIHSLEQAFKDSGFQGASLEMSLASDGRGAGEPAYQFRQEEQARALLSGFAASRYEDQEWAEPLVEASGLYQRGQPVINMLA